MSKEGHDLERTRQITALLCGILTGLVLAIVLALYAAGGFSGLRAAAKYAAVLRLIGREYVADADTDTITDDALSGAVGGLDRWSYYMDAETYAAYQDYSANVYQGIGVTVSKDEETGGFLVHAVNRDGPAQQAGITAGDIIVAVDGNDVTEEDLTYLHDLIQADFGGTAQVSVLHEDGSTETFSVSCEQIFSNPVTYTLLDGGTGYVAIDNFRQGAGAEAIAAIEDLLDEGAERLVFDVRSNPGGQVSELTELLDYLLPEGIVFIRVDKAGNEEIDRSDADCLDLPMAVVMNADSFSAAEYFAAALREYDRAVLVGEATTGKARSQITIPLTDGSAVHLSKYTYLTPQRNDLYEAGGLVPDTEAELTEDERLLLDTGWLEPEDDPQVQAAVEALS